MSQRIWNGAIVVQQGRLFLVRDQDGGPWALPGGEVLPEHPDVDEAMDQMLGEIGVKTPAIEEDFVETIYLQDESGFVVYNVYAASEWDGEPEVDHGTQSGWFAPGELDSVHMNETVKETVLELFGVRSRPDDAAEILAALSANAPEAPGGMTAHRAGAPARDDSSDRRAAGLDVLRTLRGGADPQQAFEEMRTRQPGLAEDVVDFALGEVWSDPALDRRMRSLQVVAMLGALGRTGPLRSHIGGALNHGVTPEQLVQTMRMIAAYAGFPAAIEAWGVMADVFRERDIAMPGGAT